MGSKCLEETETRQSPEESSGNGYQRLSRRCWSKKGSDFEAKVDKSPQILKIEKLLKQMCARVENCGGIGR